MNSSSPIFRFDPIRTTAWLLMTATLIGILVLGKNLIIPLAIALFLWILIGALRVQLDRWLGRGDGLPMWLANGLAILMILLALFATVGIVASQSDALNAAIPVYQANFAQLGEALATKLHLEETPTTESMLEQIDLGAILSALGDSVASVTSDVLLIVIYLGFLLAEEKTLKQKTRSLYQTGANADDVAQLLADVTESVQRYIFMKTVISILTGLVSYVVLSLVGVDFAAVWGLLIFLLNFIPTGGSMLGVVFPAVLALLQFDTLTPFLLVSVGLGLTQFAIGNLIEPAYMGKSLNLSPFMILLSLSFWGTLWGVPGAFLSVPMMVITGMFCAHVDGLRWVSVVLSSDGQPQGAE